MTSKEQFTDEQWAQVAALPGMVIGGGALSDGRKLVTTLREVAAGGATLTDVAARYPDNAVVQAWVEGAAGTSHLSGSGSVAGAVDEIGAQAEAAIATLRSVCTPEEFGQAREVLSAVVTAVVERTKGGPFGFSGDPITPEEQAFVDRITAALA